MTVGLPEAFTNHREEADDYRGELFRNGDFRVAECRDAIQWLFQRRRPTRTVGGARWRTLGYCVTRKALMRLHQRHAGWVPPALCGLPDVFRPRCAGAFGSLGGSFDDA